MKENLTRAEKFSDSLTGIHEDLLDEAIRVDSAQKLKTAHRRERIANHYLGKTVAVAASSVLIAGVISVIPNFNLINNGSETHTSIASTTASSTVGPSTEGVHPVRSVLNFDSIGEIEAFLIAVKTSPSAYDSYCEERKLIDPLSMEDASKTADAILQSEYHIRLKDGFKAQEFSALYTEDGNGILRLSFTVGQTQYVFSHFYGVTSIEEHAKETEIGKAMLGEASVSVFEEEDHFFADTVFGNTHIYAAVFTDHADGLFSEFEVVPTADAFKK